MSRFSCSLSSPSRRLVSIIRSQVDPHTLSGLSCSSCISGLVNWSQCCIRQGVQPRSCMHIQNWPAGLAWLDMLTISVERCSFAAQMHEHPATTSLPSCNALWSGRCMVLYILHSVCYLHVHLHVHLDLMRAMDPTHVCGVQEPVCGAWLYFVLASKENLLQLRCILKARTSFARLTGRIFGQNTQHACHLALDQGCHAV